MKYLWVILSTLVLLAGCSTSVTSSKTMSEAEYEDFLSGYTDSVDIHTKTLKSFSEGIETMLDENFEAFENVLTSSKSLLDSQTLPDEYEDVTKLLISSMDEYLEHVDSYNSGTEFYELDMDSFSNGTDYLIEARQELKEISGKE